MAIVLEPKTSYNLISRTESSNNKLLVHVKLTDSCLRALEEYQLVEVISRQHESANLCVCLHRTKCIDSAVFLWKVLTDSLHCLAFTLLLQVSSRRKPSIKFSGFQGVSFFGWNFDVSFGFPVDSQLGRYYLFLVSSTIIKSEPGWKWINHSTRC